MRPAPPWGGPLLKNIMNKDWISTGREVLDIEIEGLTAVRDALGKAFSEAVRALAGCTGRIAVCGLGKSGLVGRKLAAQCAPTLKPSSDCSTMPASPMPSCRQPCCACFPGNPCQI